MMLGLRVGGGEFDGWRVGGAVVYRNSDVFPTLGVTLPWNGGLELKRLWIVH